MWSFQTHYCDWYLNSLRPSNAYVSVTHTIIASDNGLSPVRRQAIIWTNAAILSIRLKGTCFSEISSKIQRFSVKKMHLKMLSAKWRTFCLSLNVLNHITTIDILGISCKMAVRWKPENSTDDFYHIFFVSWNTDILCTILQWQRRLHSLKR